MGAILSRITFMLLLVTTLAACDTFSNSEPYIIIIASEGYVQENIHIEPIPYTVATFRRGDLVPVTGIFNYRGHYWYHVLLRNGSTGFIDSNSAVIGNGRQLPIIDSGWPQGSNIWISDVEINTADGKVNCSDSTPIIITVRNTSLLQSSEMSLKLEVFNFSSAAVFHESINRIPVIQPMDSRQIDMDFEMKGANGRYGIKVTGNFDDQAYEVDKHDNIYEINFAWTCGGHP